ncbi:hypothetical protein [Spiroplasma endosymbiont of Amphimallon solstitiale]|uniref:hypothetical protein n=1 Tax=Spiroplasma endosymbiont of Amphimallon solstitiale TaxID=3066288 RepID=UPI00313D6250
MPIILLLRMILETAVTDIQTAELIEKFKKSNSLFNSFLKNPAGILKTRIFSKTLGKGKLQDELNSFNKNLQTLTNLPVIHKKIMTHITNNNIAKLQHIQKQYLNGKSLMDKGKEIIMNSLTQEDYDSMIGVYVNLSSSALAGGIWTPVIQQQSSTYGIATLTYRTNLSKSYDYFMISKEMWIDMCKATGAYGTGANSVLIRQYYHGGLDKEDKEYLARRNSKNIGKKVIQQKKYKSVIGVVNKSQAVHGYERFKNYGKQK